MQGASGLALPEVFLDDVNLIFKKKKQLKKTVVKEDKKENLNFEIEDLSPTDMQIEQDKILFDSVAEKSEITTSIEDTKKTIPRESNHKTSA